MSSLLAFHGKPEIKQTYLARVKAHAKADEIVKGRYWENGKGCAVGCTIHSSQHRNYETELGIPLRLAYLEDWLFENLPSAEAKKWPAKFLSAIKPGADLSMVWYQFQHWLLVDPKRGVIRFSGKHDAVRVAIQGVADLYESVMLGKTITNDQWAASAESAASAAWASSTASTASAAWAASTASTESAESAESAAWAARAARASSAASAESAESAARAARASSAARTARASSVKSQSVALLRFLKEAK